MKILRIAFSTVLLIAAFAFVLSRTDVTALSSAAARLSVVSVACAALLMFAGALLASWRLQIVAHDLGFRLSFRDAVSALSVGQLAGSLFFQLAGQLMARSAILSRRHIPVSGTVMITGYERFSALAVSVGLATIGTIYLFGRLHFDLAAGGTTFLKILIGIVLVVVAGAIFGWGKLTVHLVPLFAKRNLFKFSRSLVISLMIQLTTISAYVVLVTAIAPEISIANLMAASTLVMLAASLPISLAGWGMREMSAIFALGAIGLSAQGSLLVAILIGVISLIVVGLLALAALNYRYPSTRAAQNRSGSTLDYGSLLDHALPLIAATAVFFQIFIPVNRGLINVNLADPVVLLGAGIFIIHHFGHGWPVWRQTRFNTLVFATTAVMILAYLHGLAVVGWSDWAFANKLMGWFVLLAYGMTGALIVRHAKADGFDLLLRTFVVTAGAIIALDLVVLTLYRSGATFLSSVVSFQLSGFSQNRNAFGFILLLAAGAILSSGWKRQAEVLALVVVGIWGTGSRAAFLTLPFVLMAAVYMRFSLWRVLLRSGVYALALLLAITAIPIVADYASSLLAGTPFDVAGQLGTVMNFATGVESDSERLKSLRGGLDLFLSNPIFGAGLGVYYEQQVRAGHPLVIHSSPLWLLAEMGLLGYTVMVTPIVRTFITEIRRPLPDAGGIMIVLIIVAFSVMAHVHDILYQRAFWLMFGAAAAFIPLKPKRRKS